MPLGSLPPWLEIRSSDFVRAASEGAQAGLAVARLNQAADEAAARAAESSTRSAEHGQEFAEAQALRRWERNQQMQMHAEQMRAAQQRSSDELAARTAYQRSMIEARKQSEKDRADTLGETIRYHKSMEARGLEPKYHFGPYGQVLQEQGGKVTELNPAHRVPKLSIEDAGKIELMKQDIANERKALATEFDATKSRGHQATIDYLTGAIMDIQKRASANAAVPSSIPPVGPAGVSAPLTTPTNPAQSSAAPAARIPEIPTPGSSVNLFGPTPSIQPGWQNIDPMNPDAVPPPQSVSPTAPGPAMPTFPALPPRNKREKGQTYTIPGQAPHTWTGTGWLPYSAPSHDEAPADAAVDETIPPVDDEEDQSD